MTRKKTVKELIQVKWCLSCKSEFITECVCGNKRYMTGNNLCFVKDDDDQILDVKCNCGCRDYTIDFHINRSNQSVTSYTCDSCDRPDFR